MENRKKYCKIMVGSFEFNGKKFLKGHTAPYKNNELMKTDVFGGLNIAHKSQFCGC